MAEQNNAAFIWSIGKLLRGPYKQADYGKVVLPFTVLRRLDCALQSTKTAVLDTFEMYKDKSGLDFRLRQASGYSFYNTSRFTMKTLLGDPANLRANIADYVEGFSSNARRIFELYEFEKQLTKLDEKDLLYLITERFCAVDLGPSALTNRDMGLIFEELIRQFAETSNETAGEHFTPRDVVKLAVAMLFANDDEALASPGTVRSIYDPTAGTGGMLSTADEYIRNLNRESTLALYGQELNDESYAIATADMLIKGQEVENLIHGNTLTADGHAQKQFDYCIANPPFGTNWEAERSFVLSEKNNLGFDGRFGAGVPDVSDGSLLFVQHMLKKLRAPEEGGGRIAVILSSSAFYNGDAGSGYSEIRRYLLENDLVETIVGLPDSLFYNTGIPIYLWIIDNNKPVERRGKVQLIDASSQYERVRQALGQKRKEISDINLGNILHLHDKFEQSAESRIFKNTDFAYETRKYRTPLRGFVTESFMNSISGFSQESKKVLTLGEAQRHLLDEAKLRNQKLSKKQALDLALQRVELNPSAPVLTDIDGKKIYPKSGDFEESAPIGTDWARYTIHQVAPFVPDAELIDEEIKVGYEVLWARIFARKKKERSLESLVSEMTNLSNSLMTLLESDDVR